MILNFDIFTTRSTIMKNILSMNFIQVNNSIYLGIDNWGNVLPEYISSVLKCTVEYFNEILIKPEESSLFIVHWDEDSPQCCKLNDNTHMIYLTSKEHYWCQYTYQFSHEYCHHLINGRLDGELNGAFWFEETICELSSLCSLYINSQTWKLQNNYPIVESYANSYLSYLKDIIDSHQLPKNISSIHQYIEININDLESREYKRDMYSIIAVGLFELFLSKPSLWNFILFLKDTNYRTPEKYEGLSNLLEELQSKIPETINPIYKTFKSLLINK